MKENNIQALCRMEASRLGALIWRNNVGKLQDKTGRWVTYGLCVGSADLIGIYRGKFLAIEIKMPGKKTTKEQEIFLQAIRNNGGIAGVVHSPEDVESLLTSSI